MRLEHQECLDQQMKANLELLLEKFLLETLKS